MAEFTLKVNGKRQTVEALPNTPLLWVIREHLKLTGTKFGCISTTTTHKFNARDCSEYPAKRKFCSQ